MNIHYTTTTGRRDKNEDGHNIEINLNEDNKKRKARRISNESKFSFSRTILSFKNIISILKL